MQTGEKAPLLNTADWERQIKQLRRCVFDTDLPSVSMVGRLPGIVGSAGMGGAAAASKWVTAGVILGIASVLFVAGLIFRERLQALVEKMVVKKPDGPGERNGSDGG